MDPKTKAYKLLSDWGQYKTVQYSNKTQFFNAVNIEIERDTVARLAGQLHESLMDNSCPQFELDYRTYIFESHLRILKDQVIFELLKNGRKSETTP